LMSRARLSAINFKTGKDSKHMTAKKNTTPTRGRTRSRAELELRRRELDRLNVTRLGLNTWGSHTPGYIIGDLNEDVPSLRLHRRDVLIVRETATAPRNAVVFVSHESDGEETNYLGLWLQGGERVITLRDELDGGERVFLREEITYIGLAVGLIRREWRNVLHPPVQVFKGGAR
jgi:hypothetical protein